jgi:hypothetical protein
MNRLYCFFWVIPRRVNFICRSFGTLCIGGGTAYTECSEKSEYTTQTPENYPKERIQNSEHGERLKSRISALRRV